jgi:hypothetical protein
VYGGMNLECAYVDLETLVATNYCFQTLSLSKS